MTGIPQGIPVLFERMRHLCPDAAQRLFHKSSSPHLLLFLMALAAQDFTLWALIPFGAGTINTIVDG